MLREEQGLLAKVEKTTPICEVASVAPLCAKTCNITRWRSTFYMLQRLQSLKEILPKLNCEDIDPRCPMLSEYSQIPTLLSKLRDLLSVPKLLQSEETAVSDLRALLDAVVNTFPEKGHQLDRMRAFA